MALRYEPREVLLVELLPEPDRNLVDLCDEHAVSLRPPMGWTVIDERSPKPAAAAFGWLASPAP